MTTTEILTLLYNNQWFTKSKSNNKTTISINGKNIEVPNSYYHKMKNANYTILIRVSNHCTYLQTWINANLKPDKSIQNVSIVLTDVPCSYNKCIQPRKINNIDTYTYFVVEQYTYKLSNLSKSDFLKIIKRLQRIERDPIVFTDPLKNKPNKRARRDVLTPDDKDGNPIPSSNNSVHPRQTIVNNNKNNEIDFDGNIIEKQLYESIMKDVFKIIQKHLTKNHI